VKIFALLLRYWSYIYSGLFGLFMAGIAAVLLLSGSPNFRLSQIPFAQGKTALYILLALGLTGIAAALLALFRKWDTALGVLEKPAATVPPEIQALLEQRQAARAAKDWAQSDALRAAMAAQGWLVKDTPKGQVVSPA